MLKLPQGTENVIFDVIRRRYVALTLKNAQHFVHFLLAHKGYPQALWQMSAGTAERYKETL